MKTVLVLEGNEQDHKALQTLLQDHGYEVTQESGSSLQVAEVDQEELPGDGKTAEEGTFATFRSPGNGKLYRVKQAEDITFEVASPPQGAEQYYREVYEKAPLGIFRFSLEGKLLSSNLACARTFKFDSPREMVEKVNRTSIAEALYLDAGHHQDILAKILENTGWHVGEGRFRCKDGSFIDGYFHIRAVRDAEGRVVELEGYVEDISERKQIERKLQFTQFAIDKTIDQAFWIDENGRFIYVNDAATYALGYSRQELLALSIFDIDPDCSPENFTQRWQELKRHCSTTFERRHRASDGHIFPVEIRANYLVHEGREYVCFFASDISERKRAEQALMFTQFAIDNSIDQAFWMTEDARLIYVNEAACRALGYSREELLQMSIPDIGPTFPAEVFAEYWRELKKKGAVTFESLHRAKDGHIYPVEIRANYVVFDGKEYNCAFATDISERKEKEQALRLTQFAIDKSAVQAFWRVSNGPFFYVNEAACAALGYSRDELIGMSISDIDPDFSADRLADHWQDLKKNQTMCFESRHRAKDGRIYPVEVRVNYLNFDGVEYSCSFATDISERKEKEKLLARSEQRYRNLFENAPVGIFHSTLEGKFLRVNPPLARMMKFESPEEMIDMVNRTNTAEAIYGDASRRREILDDVLSHEGWRVYEEQFRCKDGSLFICNFHMRAVQRDDGNLELEGFAENITDRKQTENIIIARMRLLQIAATHTLDELLEATLDEAEKLTESHIGFYHFLEDDQKTLRLQSWSATTKRDFCKSEGREWHYPVSEAGVWVDCIHQRRPVIHNDYAALPHRKGMPSGHAKVIRELVVPVFRGEKIVAILGVGNKPIAYTQQDVETVSLLADIAWTIVENKRTEQALRESESKYRSIVEHAPFGITHSTNDGKLLSVNPALASILKYDSAQELMDTINRSSIQDVLFPKPSEREPLVDKILNTDSWTVFNNRLLCKDGSLVTCRVHSRRIVDEDGQARGFESYQENITDQVKAVQALRESEEKFRVLAETSPVAICIYQEERLVYANPAMERLFGYDAEELCRMKFWDWVHDDFKDLIRERGLARLAGEKVPGQYEAKYLTKTGKERYVLVSAGVIEYQGRPTGVASFLDITERKRSEELIQSSLAEKEMLLREIHHRVKNNLQVVSSLLYLQAQKLTDPELQNHFLESQSRICSMALAHEQLYQSKSLAEVSLRSYVESLVGQLQQVFQRPEQQIECRTVVGDIVLDIAQVIPCGLLVTELLSNAYKHAFVDGRNGTITISMEQVEGQFVLSVADDGVGLPANLDYRQTTTLGLQLVTALVNQLNGTVVLEREGGTLFRVTFAEAAHRDNQADQQASDSLF